MSWKDFKFEVLQRISGTPSRKTSIGVLRRDNWDDFGYKTTFSLCVYEPNGKRHKIGSLKIANVETLEVGRTKIRNSFKRLGENYASIGLQVTYYENLRSLPKIGQKTVLSRLRDVSYSEDIWLSVHKNKIVTTSLLRSIPTSLVEGQYRRIAQGGDFQVAYDFSYRLPKRSSTGDRIELSFEVDVESPIPTNVHAIIGRNGVGKSYLFDLMTKALLAKAPVAAQSGVFDDNKRFLDDLNFTGVVTVSFSAFDQFDPLVMDEDKRITHNYFRIGLVEFRKAKDSKKFVYHPKTSAELETEFSNCCHDILTGGRVLTWQKAVKKLNSDRGFSDLNISGLLDFERYIDTAEATEDDPVEFRNRFIQKANEVFHDLSSGHKIVLLTLSRLVQCVEEKTLVLIDEPECHLHPPLLSAFIRALSEFMTKRNGVAIIATHSPVVLQEVPKTCVWKLTRFGNVMKAARPEHETFGENVGILTSRVFQHEVTDSGYHTLLEKAANDSETYEDALSKLGGSLGSEAKAVLMGMVNLKAIS